MGWTTSPAVQNLVNGFLGSSAGQPAGTPTGSDSFWNNMFADPSTMMNSGLYNASIQRAGEAGRAINEGGGVNPQMAGAGGGDQWNLALSQRNAARNTLGARTTQDVAGVTSRAIGEGGQYELERGKQQDQFNLDKYKVATGAVNRASKFVVSPWYGVLQSLISGGAQGVSNALATRDTGGGAGHTESIDFGPGGYTPGQMPGDEFSLPGMTPPGSPDLSSYYG